MKFSEFSVIGRREEEGQGNVSFDSGRKRKKIHQQNQH